MRNFQKKKRISHFFESIPALVLLGIGLAFFAYSMIGLTSRMRETSKNKKVAEENLAELQKNKDELNQNIAKLNTDEGVEESIREKFGVVKPGEGVIVIVDDKDAVPAEPKSKSSSFISFFKNLFR